MARWFRSHASKLDNPKVQRLSDAHYRAWDSLLCAACRYDGVLPPLADTAFLLRKSEAVTAKLIETLIAAELFIKTERGIEPHEWNEWQYKSDVSTERVKQHRERQRNVSCNVSETPSENQSQKTETDSVPNGTGAKAPARDVIFQECLPWLEKRSGKNCRALVGKWLSETRDDNAIRQLLEEAEHENPMDPVSWISARLKPKEPHETYDQRRIRAAREAIQ